MRYLILLFILIVSCSQNSDNRFAGIHELNTKEFDTVSLFIKEPFLNYYFEGYKSANLDGDDYLVGLNFMRNKIDFIHLHDSSKSFSMQVRREGPKAVKSYLLGINFFKNKFLLLTHSNAYLCEMDIHNQTYDLIKSYDFLPDHQLLPVSSNMLSPSSSRTWAFDETDIFFPIFPSIPVTDQKFTEFESLARIDMTTGELSTVGVKWPRYLKGREGFTFPYQLDAYSYKIEGKLYISYPFTDSVYIYNVGNYDKPIDFWTLGVKEFDELVHFEDIPQEVLYTNILRARPFNRSGLFFPLQFNEEKDLFYRVVKGKFPNNSLEKNAYMISRATDKWLVEFNINGELLKITSLPKEFDVVPLLVNGEYWFPFISGYNNKEDVMQLAKVKGYSK